MRLTTTLRAHNCDRFRMCTCSTIDTQRKERSFEGRKGISGWLEQVTSKLLISSTVAARGSWCSELIADINELTYVYVTLALFSRRLPRGKYRESRGQGWYGTPGEEGRLEWNGYAKGSVTNEACSQVLYSVGPVLVNYNHYGHLPSRGAITAEVSIPGAILVKLNAPNQLLGPAS